MNGAYYQYPVTSTQKYVQPNSIRGLGQSDNNNQEPSWWQRLFGGEAPTVARVGIDIDMQAAITMGLAVAMGVIIGNAVSPNKRR